MSREIRKLPAPHGGRVEDGPVRFGDDWPGVFIRGDSASYFAMQLQSQIADDSTGDGFEAMMRREAVESLLRLLQSAMLNP